MPPSKICLFDLLPVELLHTLFTYFSAHEILFSFFNINDHVDAVLLAYRGYRLNFKSILKWQYDIVCRRIRPDQVLSLTLSDNSDTPDQSKLFFSRFRIEKFIRLRSLTLLDIEFESLESIFSNLHQLHELRSLSMHYFTFKWEDSQSRLTYSQTTSRVTSYFSNISPQVLLRLHRLNLGPGINFDQSISLPYLRYLALSISTHDNLQTISPQMQQLCSLDVTLRKDASNIKQFCISSQLRWLTLRILDSLISMNQMEHFLSNLPHLKHFELQAKGSSDLADGYRWQILSNDFITFNFRLKLYRVELDRIIDSFRTSFWLQTKRWYVAYIDQHLCSVPHFASTDVINSYNPPRTYSTAPDNTVFYDHIVNATVIEPRSITTLHRFCQLEVLNIRCSISSEILLDIADLNCLQHLSLPSLDNIRSLMLLLNALPRLRKLSIIGGLTPDFIEHIGDHRAEQIRTLDIHTVTRHLSYIFEGIIRLFPRIERLSVSIIKLTKDVIRLIDGFQYLSNASFIIGLPSIEGVKNRLYTHSSRRLKSGTFTYRLHPSMKESFCELHLWIGEQPPQSWWIMHWPPRRGYRWHRLMHILFYYFVLILSKIFRRPLMYISL